MAHIWQVCGGLFGTDGVLFTNAPAAIESVIKSYEKHVFDIKRQPSEEGSFLFYEMNNERVQGKVTIMHVEVFDTVTTVVEGTYTIITTRPNRKPYGKG